jgi:multifunctional methyltransferase subunit TRM112
MKLLTHNFLSCAAKTCKASPNAFPLKFEDVELSTIEVDSNPQFLINVLPRVDWPALVQTSIEVHSGLSCSLQLGNTSLPGVKPENLSPEKDEQLLRLLHSILLEVSRSFAYGLT